MFSLRVPVLRRIHLRRSAAITCATAPLLIAACAGSAQARTGALTLDGRERAVIERINAVRSDHHLGPLTPSPKLSHAADRHSVKLLARRTLSHQLPGEKPLQQRLGLGLGSLPVGEVVLFARGGGSASIVRAWMDSPGHRAVLLSPKFHVAGIGIRSRGGGLYATVDVAAR